MDCLFLFLFQLLLGLGGYVFEGRVVDHGGHDVAHFVIRQQLNSLVFLFIVAVFLFTFLRLLFVFFFLLGDFDCLFGICFFVAFSGFDVPEF